MTAPARECQPEIDGDRMEYLGQPNYREYQRLTREIAKLTKALEWYAKDYDHALGCSQWDGGAKARAAISGGSDGI